MHKFTFHTAYSTDFGQSGVFTEWNLSTFGPLLQIHKSTLTHICIGGLNGDGLTEFDVSDFPVLESLDLTSNATGTQIGLVGNLLAPNLHHFRWDLSMEDQQCVERLSDLDEPQEMWLRTLIRKARQRTVPLQSIEIEYRPNNYLPEPMDMRELKRIKYPWDRIDHIAKDTGVEITYNRPTISKADFRALLRVYENKIKKNVD